MIARPKISRNERKTAEMRAFEVGNFAPFSCPGHRDVFRSTIFHRYTTTDESLLGRDVASLHELANIEIHPPAAERSRSATDARARLGSGVA